MPGSQCPMAGAIRQFELRLLMEFFDTIRHWGCEEDWSSLVSIAVVIVGGGSSDDILGAPEECGFFLMDSYSVGEV